ncbi:hypothetical protein [Paracoccus marcusii]|uniref:Molybdopterin guanine dinucleotide synthesis n=1 Tax=Paracoccus marcusii TaxID=59779 RepID=A0ABY7UWT8_9RHOB|nr:hypothetical protein [Paracoccus marcusii]WDA13258.1 hypothetical protein PRL19_03075 [Paracoccus marcusii]
MPRFDRIVVLDWSAAGRPTRGADSIWIGDDRGLLANPPTRMEAHHLLQGLAEPGTRLLIGADFAFGHPSGLARQITGRADALALWDHLDAQHSDDARNCSNYRDVAAGLNRALDAPVFWGDGRRLPTPDLPRLRPPPHPDLKPHRVTETPAPGGPRPKSPFQLAGAGAVGAQSLTGIPWLNRLRQRAGTAVWPFQPWQDAELVLAEVYPSMLGRLDVAGWPCLDAAQVGLLARTLRALDDRDALMPMLAPDPRITDLAAEGQILGFGHDAALRAAMPRTGDGPMP